MPYACLHGHAWPFMANVGFISILSFLVLIAVTKRVYFDIDSSLSSLVPMTDQSIQQNNNINVGVSRFSESIYSRNMKTQKRNIHFFDLYWEDILVSKVLPYLTIQECFNFRCVSKTCLQISNMYISKMNSLKLMNKGFSPHTFGVFNSCTKLTVINLSKCTTLNDSEIIPIFRHNVNLTHLNLSQCKTLSAKCLQPVILYCTNLKVLKLSRCAWLTTGAVEALALHQSRIEDADLSYCPIISESCIQIFIKKFRHLKIFNLEGNKQVSDKSLVAMSKYSNSLSLLNLGGCSDITDKGIKALAVHCSSLQGLLIRGCSKVTENSLRLMRNRVHLDRRPAEPVPQPIYVQI